MAIVNYPALTATELALLSISEFNARVYDGGTYTTITSAAWAARTEVAVCVYGNRIENM
jgi:hypothetical protein